MALLSLVFLLVAIFLGFFRKMNTGLVCIAFALVLGRLAGVTDKEIIRGFNSSLFIMLLGVTYLFSLAQINGCLDLLAKKVVSLAGKRVYLVPIIIDGLLKSGKATVKVLETPDRWIGITYQEDTETAQKGFADMIAAGEYPEKLWG